jgi:hypothetical protein
MLKPLLLFVGVRCAMALAIAQLLPLHDSRPLSAMFNDLALYNGTANPELPLWAIPNPLYAALVRWLGYGHSQLQDWHFVALSLMLNLLFSAVFVVVACRVMRPKHNLMYAAILGAHPYLALYSLKLDTSIFALLPVGLLTAAALTQLRSSWALMATGVSSLFRNAVLPMGWLQMLCNLRSWRSFVGVLGVAVLALSTALQLGYGTSYLGQNYGCYSLSRVSTWMASQGLADGLATALGLVITPLIHVLLDLGAREAVANHCLLLPANLAQQVWLHLGATGCFMLLHGWLLVRLIATVKHLAATHPPIVQLVFPLAMLLPTLYGAAHMRYLIPIIPLLLVFLFDPKQISNPNPDYNPKTLA